MNTIEIQEVGPRDGFQNVKEYIPLNHKIEIVEGLLAAGVDHIQICSFVSPRAIPQMRESRELTEHCLEHHPSGDFFALVPNLRGAQSAREAGLIKVSYVVSLSESHNEANIRKSHEASFAELLKIRDAYPDLEICLDLATAFACPFEGMKSEEEVLPFLKPYLEQGIASVNLCDTIGLANPGQVRRMIRAMKDEHPSLEILVHIHDTRNMGMVNTLAAIEEGVTRVQSTLGGLGGCPFAPGASGNLATEDLVFMLKEMGYPLDIRTDELVKIAQRQSVLIPEGRYSGHLFRIQEKKES